MIFVTTHQDLNLVTYHFVKEAPIEAIIMLYQAGGWWKEDPRWRASILPMIKGSFAFVIAQDLQGQIVGMGRAISDGCSDAYIQDVVVLQSYRKQGIGAKIIHELVKYCQMQGLFWIGLIAEPGTHHFYESLGFKTLKNYQPMLFNSGISS